MLRFFFLIIDIYNVFIYSYLALKKLITVFRISKVYSIALPQNEWCKYDEPVRHFALKLSLKLHKLLFKLAGKIFHFPV